MAELKSIPEKPILNTHYPLERKRNPRKRWVIAASRSNQAAQQRQNFCLENDYNRVIEAVKTYLKPSTTYFERDYKTDKSFGIFCMHSFCTPNFYWTLDCDLCYDYQVTYAFDDCPYEAEVRKMLKAYPLDRGAKEKQMEPDFVTFFKTVLQVQDNQFIKTI